MNEVILLKLNSTEEVIGTIIDETESSFTLSKPRVLYPVQQPDGSVSSILVPWLMGSQNPMTGDEADVILEKSSIIGSVSVENVPTPLVNMYTSKTTGIDLS